MSDDKKLVMSLSFDDMLKTMALFGMLGDEPANQPKASPEVAIDQAKVADYLSYIQFLRSERDYLKQEVERLSKHCISPETAQQLRDTARSERAENGRLTLLNEKLRSQKTYLVSKVIKLSRKNKELYAELAQSAETESWEYKTMFSRLHEAKNLLLRAASFIDIQVVTANCSADDRGALVMVLRDTARTMT